MVSRAPSRTPRAACWRLGLVVVLLSTVPIPAADEVNRMLTPAVRPPVPEVRDRAWPRNPLDAFVLARLENAGLYPNPAADRLTLLRRVTFDLTGLVPSSRECEAFLADRAPDAYEQLVDRLLASPRFGERWAQHWLDVVRYADSDGFKLDRLRPQAYRYRDWVIAAFNADLPYRRFVRQQVAGDELEPDNPEAQIATGFYRLPPEEMTGSDYRQVRQDILDDVTDVFSLSFLGLTVGCARCHDHKFDPISQKDYYRLQAFFAPLAQRDDRSLASPAELARYQEQLARWEKATEDLREAIDALLEAPRAEIRKEVVQMFDADTQQALQVPADSRTPLQTQLAALASKQVNRRRSLAFRRLPPDRRTQYNGLVKKLAEYDTLKPTAPPPLMAASDVGSEAPPTRRLLGGNLSRPKEELTPAFPEALPGGACHPVPRPGSTGRRAALAEWLCRPDHPLTGRVIANRLWQHHTGRGIVATPNDFGVMGTKPTHPELLDYLASELTARRGSLKALHRLIVTSATYRQSSRPEHNPAAARAARVDGGNDLLWHARQRRRDAEAIRDAVLQASGQLDLRLYGPAAQPELPTVLAESRSGWQANPRPEDRCRRSVYVIAVRNLALPLFAAFDQPDRHQSCPVRVGTTTAPQALVLLNGEFALTEARHLAEHLLGDHPGDDRGRVRAAYRHVLGRDPDAIEATAARRFLARQARLVGAVHGKEEALVDLCHALMNTAEFLTVE